MDNFLYVFLLIFCTVNISCHVNNVCPTYEDYYTMENNVNCEYNPAAELNATEVIKFYGYPLEIHEPVTPDGYILPLFRIPNKFNGTRKHPVFLQHALFTTAASYVALQRDSLPFLLSDAGYDVWLGNSRGNEYANKHINTTIDDPKFWDFCVDDLALIDLPTELEYISNVTGQQGNIIYIGHSIGTTVGFMYSSWYPTEAKKYIKILIALAPAYSLSNTNARILRFILPITRVSMEIGHHFGGSRFMTHTGPMRIIFKSICMANPYLMKYCMGLVNMFVIGPSSKDEPITVPVMFNQVFSSTSPKTVIQEIELIEGQIRRYDYGEKNMERYGFEEPPIYNLSQIEVPVIVYYSISDWLNAKKDAVDFYKRIPQKIRRGIHKINLPDFNHGAFVYHKNAKKIVYDSLLETINKID